MFGDLKQLSLKTINASSPYDVISKTLEGVDNYAAMILRKDNPRFVDYVSEFNNTVNMFMLKPEH